jgi:hypothetical protein
MRPKTLQKSLDGDVPTDVPHWIVEFHDEFDERDMTPVQAAQRAHAAIFGGVHCCTVTHVRSGLRWSVDLGKQGAEEVIEIGGADG